MGTEATLEKKIIDRLRQHKAQLAEKQEQLDTLMKEFLEQRSRLSVIAEGKINKIIFPRMQQLARQFENAEIQVINTDEGHTCLCKFAHTPRFPATVQVSVALLPVPTEQLTVRYDLNIFPALMEFCQNAEATIPTADDESLVAWVEDKILGFLDDYLRLEIHPLYQKDNLVLDVVCGMRISFISASSILEQDGRTYYFCSEHCKQTYLDRQNH